MVIPAKPPEPRPLPAPAPLPAVAPDPVPRPAPFPVPWPASVPVPPLPEPVSVPRPVPVPPPPGGAVPPLPFPAPITISSTLLPAAALTSLPIAAGPVVVPRCFEPGAVCTDAAFAAGEPPKRARASAAGMLGGRKLQLRRLDQLGRMSYRGLVLPYIERSRRGVSHLHNVGQRHKIPQHRRKFQPRLKKRLLSIVGLGRLGKNRLRPGIGRSFAGSRRSRRRLRLDFAR